MAVTLDLTIGDITQLHVDAIVNAANDRLARGGGVCGAIFQAAGPDLVGACQELGACPTGQARVTKGFNLPAQWIIHAVGPVWQGGHRREDALLQAAYMSSIGLASQHNVKTLAFPAISTGIYGFPLERATRIAVETVRMSIVGHRSLERVVFVCFDPSVENVYRRILRGAGIAV